MRHEWSPAAIAIVKRADHQTSRCRRIPRASNERSNTVAARMTLAGTLRPDLLYMMLGHRPSTYNERKINVHDDIVSMYYAKTMVKKSCTYTPDALR